MKVRNGKRNRWICLWLITALLLSVCTANGEELRADGTAAGQADTTAGEDDTAAGQADTTVGEDGTAAGQDSTATGGNDGEITGSFSYLSSLQFDGNGALEVHDGDFVYSDDYFSGNSYVYRKDLAAMSIRMAMSAFGQGKGAGPAGILDLFYKLGFTYTKESVHYPEPTADSIGYAIGSKSLGSRTLVAVAIRGGSYGAEWASNMTLGNTDEHQGFHDAGRQVYEGIREYLKQFDNRTVALWITGYSRAAAVANVTGHLVNEGIAAGELPASLGTGAVYTYCFECPATVVPKEPVAADANIFSVVNDLDIVTRLAPREWGYDRYGITLRLPSWEATEKYSEYRKAMTDYFKSFTGERAPMELRKQADTLETIMKWLLEKTESRDNYVKKFQDGLRKSMSEQPKKDNQSDLGQWLEKVLVGSFLTELAADYLIGAHYPELCLSWIETTEPEDLRSISEFWNTKEPQPTPIPTPTPTLQPTPIPTSEPNPQPTSQMTASPTAAAGGSRTNGSDSERSGVKDVGFLPFALIFAVGLLAGILLWKGIERLRSRKMTPTPDSKRQASETDAGAEPQSTETAGPPETDNQQETDKERSNESGT